MNKLKIIMTTLFFILFLITVTGFTASNNNYDVNYGYESVVGGQASNASTDANFVSGEYSGNCVGGNIDANIGIFFPDENNLYAPTITITSPYNNYSTTFTSITLTYIGNDLDNSITDYWVRIDSNEWINNGLNTQYTFTGLSLGTHTLSVKATDETDLNSNTETVTISIVQQSNSNNGGSPNLCKNFIGSEKCDETEYCPEKTFKTSDTLNCCPVLCLPRFKEKNMNSFIQFAAFEDKISKTAVNEVYEDNRFIGKQLALPNEIIVSRTINSHIVFDKNVVVSVDINVTVNVKNMTDSKTFTNVSIVESIPKQLTETVENIVFVEKPRILVIDPIVEWIEPELKPREEKNYHYSLTQVNDLNILKNLKEFFDSLPTPTVMIQITEQDLCEGIQCNDNNPCTQDYCSKGKCYYSNREGMDCGLEKICYENACIPKKLLNKPEPKIEIRTKKENPELLYIILGLLLVIIILIIILIKVKDKEIEEEKLLFKRTKSELRKAEKMIQEEGKPKKKRWEL